ncbi:hypothetical protein EJ02DRAFT_3387 [Clathrospora elynae]|uniref:Uncharacterized protein n=1 Tax=Clathrospora elynae TaxID=706981 RepID=A0A6A5T571_9PLEO|nr:hypothetical protein EJ02DRAFT_3387 [Clathrospora elynae]
MRFGRSFFPSLLGCILSSPLARFGLHRHALAVPRQLPTLLKDVIAKHEYPMTFVSDVSNTSVRLASRPTSKKKPHANA